MFRNLSPYGDTRPTTLPWAPTLPRHWRIERAKTVMRTVDVRSAAGDEELLTVSSKRGVVPRASAKVSMFRAESYVGHKLCWPDDLVINSLWAWGRGLGVARHHGIVSTAYGVYRQRKADLDPSYLNELVRSEPFQWELQVRSQGVWKSRLQISDERWLDAPLLVPPADEQAAIVNYLAHANARIDKAIAAKRRLIALLEEQKRVEVSTLISSGDVNTGDRWFPVVRNGWSVVPLGRVLHRAVDGPHFSPTYSDSGVPFLSARNIRPGAWSFDDLKYVDEGLAAEFDRRVRPEKGDVLYTKGGTTGVAKAVDLDERFQVWVHIAVLKLIRDLVSPEFLEIVLNSPACYEQSQLETRGATNQDLGLGRMKRISIPLAPPEAQASFVRQARIAAQKINSVTQKTRREIELLQEFRTRLVADVVTGQVDVRAIAVTLPDAPESFDNTVSATDDDLEEALSEGEE